MNPAIPVYVSVVFLMAFSFPLVMIAGLARKHALPTQGNRLFLSIILFYLMYLTVVAIASFQGLFDEVTLPPRIVQFTTLPLLVFLVGLIFNRRWFKELLKRIPAHDLIRLHRFRLIGSFFLILLALGLLPPVFALVAGVGDVLTALSSWWVARLVQSQATNHRTIALVWNTFGFLDILATSFMAILFTEWSMEAGTLGVEVLANFPFCFIPAFAPATILFLHFSIYRKLLVKEFH